MTIFTSPFGDIALRDQTITERVMEGLAMRPEATALIDGPTGRTVTAAELISAIQSLAGGLAARGIGAAMPVSVVNVSMGLWSPSRAGAT